VIRRRTPLVALFSAVATVAAVCTVGSACSLFNAPADVIPGSGGGGTGAATTTVATAGSTSTGTTTTATATTSSVTTGTGGGASCQMSSDCPPSTDPCQVSACDASGVCTLTAAADATACDDGLYCTVDDACQGGVCTGTARPCPAQDACNPGMCQEAAQACGSAPGNDGQACPDGNPCDAPGTCSGGVCQKGADACAALATECISSTCTSTGCTTQNKLNGTGCGMSYCSNGLCEDGHCNITPINEGKSCPDDLFCTIDETCQSGFCVGVPNPCPATAPCVQGSCDEAEKACVMTAIADDMPCDDGDPCTADEFCSDQMCTGGLKPTILFSETFASNGQGWTLGDEWQIGHAKASSGQTSGHPDPGQDYTGEGGVAGVEIGGNAAVANPNPAHGLDYLTSPPVNTLIAGSIYLTFYRFLNSDYAPYMTNTVEASTDGVTWTVVWQSGAAPPITDSQWTFESIDISAYTSATTRFRFGFSIGDPGVFTVSSWNLDDVKVQNAPCPAK
jgi:hypothetical protein